MNKFITSSFPENQSVINRGLRTLGPLAVAASFLLAPNLAHADEASLKSDTATATIDMTAKPSPSPKEPDFVVIDDSAMYPVSEPSPTNTPDIGVNDDGLHPVQSRGGNSLPDTGFPAGPSLLVGLGLVGVGASIIVASKRQ